MLEKPRAWICAATAVATPLVLLWLGGEARALPFGFAGVVLLVFGHASPWLIVLAALPLLQLLPGPPPTELAEAMAAARVAGPGTIAADPSALWPEMLALTGSLVVFALARTAAQAAAAAAWWSTVLVALFGCLQAALGLAQGPGAAGTLVNRGQYAALLELSFGAGCGLAAAAWTSKTWRERLEERALSGGLVGLAAAGLSLAGIAISLSRTGMVAGALAAFVAAAWFGRRRLWVVGALPIAVLGLALATPRLADRAVDRFDQLLEDSGDPGRSAVWADTLALANENGLAGVGLGSFSSAFRRSSFYLPRKSIDHAHSDYLEWLVELGAPATVLLLGSVLVTFMAAARKAIRSPLAFGCLLGAGMVLLHATVDLPLQSPGLTALLAALLGFASVREKRQSVFVAQAAGLDGSRVVATEAARIAGMTLGLAITTLALLAPNQTETPRSLYRAASEASAKGHLDQASQLYRQALNRNLLAAPPWLRLAEIERSSGCDERARLFFQAARTVEPFTLRTEWPLAEMELATGETAEAVQRLAGLVAAAPELLDAALRTAWRSGATSDDLERLVPRGDPEAVARYLAFLVRNRAASDLYGAYARLGEPALPEPYRDWLAREAGFQP